MDDEKLDKLSSTSTSEVKENQTTQSSSKSQDTIEFLYSKSQHEIQDSCDVFPPQGVVNEIVGKRVPFVSLKSVIRRGQAQQTCTQSSTETSLDVPTDQQGLVKTDDSSTDHEAKCHSIISTANELNVKENTCTQYGNKRLGNGDMQSTEMEAISVDLKLTNNVRTQDEVKGLQNFSGKLPQTVDSTTITVVSSDEKNFNQGHQDPRTHSRTKTSDREQISLGNTSDGTPSTTVVKKKRKMSLADFLRRRGLSSSSPLTSPPSTANPAMDQPATTPSLQKLPVPVEVSSPSNVMTATLLSPSEQPEHSVEATQQFSKLPNAVSPVLTLSPEISLASVLSTTSSAAPFENELQVRYRTNFSAANSPSDHKSFEGNTLPSQSFPSSSTSHVGSVLVAPYMKSQETIQVCVFYLSLFSSTRRQSVSSFLTFSILIELKCHGVNFIEEG